MSILKLIPGQRLAFTVSKVEQVQGKFGPQYAFHGATPDDADALLYLNVDAAERQLTRLGYTVETVVGQAVEIERTEKNGTKYTNINPLHAYRAANPVPPAKPAAPAKQPYSAGGPLPYENQETGAPPEVPSGTVHPRLDNLLTVYEVCFDKAHSLAEAKFGQDESHEATAAMAATLLIAAKDMGLVR